MRITIRELVAEGWEITLADLAVLSPTWPARIQRFGVYATDEVALPPSHSTPPRLRPGAAS
jgi:hypothetical protein